MYYTALQENVNAGKFQQCKRMLLLYNICATLLMSLFTNF